VQTIRIISFKTTFMELMAGNVVDFQSHSNGIDGSGDIGGAAGTLVLEWARKLFEREFVSVTQLAEHLIASGFVSSRSLEAFSIIAAASSRADGSALGLMPVVGKYNEG
jgi:hypothetical protein